jgi:hypothetical protein
MAVKCQGCCYAICFNLFYYHHLLCFFVIANYELLSVKTHTHTHSLSQILTYFEATILDFCQTFKNIYM